MTRYEECLKRLDDFNNLEEGWDDYQAEKIDPRSIENAKKLTYLLKAEDDLSVYPMPNSGVQIEYFKEIENKDYEIEVFHDNINIISYKATRDNDIAKLEKEMDNEEIKRKIEYFGKVQETNNFISVWSMFEINDIYSKHYLNDFDYISYEGNTIKLDGETWLDIWRIADELIRKSGDFHHIFIENIHEDENNILTLSTGS